MATKIFANIFAGSVDPAWIEMPVIVGGFVMATGVIIIYHFVKNKVCARTKVPVFVREPSVRPDDTVMGPDNSEPNTDTDDEVPLYEEEEINPRRSKVRGRRNQRRGVARHGFWPGPDMVDWDLNTAYGPLQG